MIRFAIVVAIPAFCSGLQAQGVLSLSGSYAFGSIRTELGCPSPPGGGAVTDRGVGSFGPLGAFSFSGTEHEVCGGVVGSRAISEAGRYRVAKNGRLDIDVNPAMPGTDVVSFHVSPDGGVFLGTRDEPEPEGALSVGVRLSSGQSNALLSGRYTLARLEVDGTVSGIAAASGLGQVTFDGTGAYAGSWMRSAVTVAGATSSAVQVLSGGYTVQPDGRLSLAASYEGAVADGGDMFFAVEFGGTSNALVVGVREGAPLGSDIAGDWAVALLVVLPSAFAEIVTNRITGSFVPGGPVIGTFDFDNYEVQTDPSGTTAQQLSASAPYRLGAGGSLSVGGPPPTPGAFDAGARSLVLGPSAPDEATLGIGLRLCPAVDYGVPTPGTGGIAPTLDLRGGFPLLGNAAFQILLEDGLGGALAAIAIADAAAPGVPFLGGTAWLDPARVFQSDTILLDPAGGGRLPLPLPATPSLAGLTFYFQGLVLDAGAPGPFSLTAGMRLSLCMP